MSPKPRTADPRSGVAPATGGTVLTARDFEHPAASRVHQAPGQTAQHRPAGPGYAASDPAEAEAPEVGVVPLGAVSPGPAATAPAVAPQALPLYVAPPVLPALPPQAATPVLRVPEVRPVPPPAPARPSEVRSAPPPAMRQVPEERPTPLLADEMPEAWVRPRRAPRVAFRAGRVVAALYTLAGVAPLALGVGPRQFFWAAVAVVSLTTYVTVGWFWEPLRGMMQTARLPLVPFLAVLFLAHSAGALAWSRALSRTVGDPRFAPRDLPRAVRHPLLVALAGLVLPGFGHVVTGHARRAALAFWNAANVVFASLVLAHSSLLWHWNERSAADALPRLFVEGLVLACGAVLFLGGLAWIGAALDGARLALGHRAIEGLPPRVAPGDAVAVALLVSLGVLALCTHPGRLAADLDSLGGALQFSNYRLVPLVFESAAMRLDPGRPEYALRVAALHADMGHPEKARAIHDRLRERWEAYAELVLEHGTSPAAARPLRALAPPPAAAVPPGAGH